MHQSIKEQPVKSVVPFLLIDGHLQILAPHAVLAIPDPIGPWDLGTAVRLILNAI